MRPLRTCPQGTQKCVHYEDMQHILLFKTVSDMYPFGNLGLFWHREEVLRNVPIMSLCCLLLFKHTNNLPSFYSWVVCSLFATPTNCLLRLWDFFDQQTSEPKGYIFVPDSLQGSTGRLHLYDRQFAGISVSLHKGACGDTFSTYDQTA